MLFLDKLTEFRRDAIEALRQPLEDGRVVVRGVSGSVVFPARFTLVAAAIPVPLRVRRRRTAALLVRGGSHHQYRQKLSGPLLDRIDLRCLCGRRRGGENDSKRAKDQISPPVPTR